ncbi:(R)-mandelonitrile lyase [Nostocoides australiense]|uniref:Cupin 2 domain-containing protein n=1 Tax=Nostocoides australiense Ben110 TaxID=1193182 RepID=W6K4H5_9MICO|nr:Cupin 2 domain-containing protein [Tetrasphaera australiensis Ben110]
MAMEKRGIPTTTRGPADWFTGDVHVENFATGADASRLVAAHVRFTPGARTNWHSHGLGQTLHCTSGTGFVVTRDGVVQVLRPGETVWTPPGEEHWHGATPDTMLCHDALLVAPETGDATTWLEPVTDEQYAAAHRALDS